MPAVPPAGGAAPGVVTNTGQFPQWSAGGGTPGSAAGWKVVEATSAAQKASFEKQGFLIWFSSDAAAKAFVTSESSPVSSGEPQNAIPGLTQVGDFFASLTQANTWIRVVKVLAGGLLLAIGIAHITGAGNAVASAARKVPVPI